MLRISSIDHEIQKEFTWPNLFIRLSSKGQSNAVLATPLGSVGHRWMSSFLYGWSLEGGFGLFTISQGGDYWIMSHVVSAIMLRKWFITSSWAIVSCQSSRVIFFNGLTWVTSPIGLLLLSEIGGTRPTSTFTTSRGSRWIHLCLLWCGAFEGREMVEFLTTLTRRCKE